jgi:hypothetical protein
VVVTAFLGLFGKKRETQKFDFPSADLDIPPLPPSADFESSAERPNTHFDFEDIKKPVSPFSGKEDLLPFEHMQEIESPVMEDFIAPGRKVLNARKSEGSNAHHVFIERADFRQLLDNIKQAKAAIAGIFDEFGKASKLGLDEDREYEKWSKGVTDVQRRLLHVERILFKG